MGKFNAYEHYKQYRVEAENVEEFLKKYTKYDRHEGRGMEYVEARIKSHSKDLEKYGFTFMTHFESKMGEVVSFYKEV